MSETNRPLNKYVEAVEAFHCPADRGDSMWPTAKTAYEGWGNSYLVQWSVDYYRVKQVTGDSKAPRASKEGTPIKTSEIARKAVNKIIQGDWHWYGTRDINDLRSVWHNYRGKRTYNMLMGDGHVENFIFPKEYVNWLTAPPPDPNFKWW